MQLLFCLMLVLFESLSLGSAELIEKSREYQHIYPNVILENKEKYVIISENIYI